jgi:hypothetical protein
MDCRALEHGRIIVQEFPYELRHCIRMAYLEDQIVGCHRELQDGGALPVLWWKVLLLHILHYVGVLAVQANALGILWCTVDKLPMHTMDPALYAR